ncbi:MAG: hypothetical protein ACT4PT_09580 [Methanobacteriota archaeon]
MKPSLALAVDFSSGLLLAALGVWVATLRPRRGPNVVLARFLVAFGGAFMYSNARNAGAIPPNYWIDAFLFAAAAAAALPLGVVAPTRLPGPRMRIAAATWGGYAVLWLSYAGAMVEGWSIPGWGLGDLPFSLGVANLVVMGLIFLLVATSVLWALRFREAGDSDERRRLAVLSAGVGAYAVMYCVQTTIANAGDPLWGTRPALQFLAVAPFAAAFLGALSAWTWNVATRPDTHLSRNLILFFAALAAIGSAAAKLAGDDGFAGVARLLGALVLTVALLRGQFLEVDLKLRWSISRSTTAALFVAVFFVASESAQAFFGDENPWLGIVAAGALVFAIQPLSRVADRLAERAVPIGHPAPSVAASAAARREHAYRDAVRLALRDRTLTREEERRLLRLAEELGIPAGRAAALHEEVERERGAT